MVNCVLELFVYIPSDLSNDLSSDLSIASKLR